MRVLLKDVKLRGCFRGLEEEDDFSARCGKRSSRT